tara:strand:- start:621 stop:1097 length:477 start_codon:yes stop_codon:yes gene_type:complete
MAKDGKLDDMAVQMSEEDYERMAKDGKLDEMAVQMSEEDYEKLDEEAKLAPMVSNMEREGLVEIGKAGNLDGLTDALESTEIEDMNIDLRDGMLEGLDADYLRSEGETFDKILESTEISASTVKFDDASEESNPSERFNNSEALDMLKTILSSVAADA